VKLAPLSVAEIAKLTQGTMEGDAGAVITGVAPIEQAGAGDLTFIAQPRFLDLLPTTPAAAVLLDRHSVLPADTRPATLIRVANPYFAFVQVLKLCVPAQAVATGVADTAHFGANVRLGEGVAIGPYAIIADDCEIGEGVQIGAQCFVGRGTRIGANTILCAGVRVAHEVQIGKNVIIQYGSVIGSDGFGYVHHEGRQHKIPHLGTVVLEDEVEIGANCCIDRGTFGETRVKRGAKLDNLVHVAHNVTIGEGTVIAAQTGISGSTTIGRDVTIAGQVGFVGHIDIGDRAILGAQAGVTKSIPAGLVVSGYPARDHRKAKREEASLRRLPELVQRVRFIEKFLKIDRKGEGD
jgi:UDP-3-O-[3-hydroxymyristoyl] glucosamine N-acyltransferase